jgi:serine/threonine protein kinase
MAQGAFGCILKLEDPTRVVKYSDQALIESALRGFQNYYIVKGFKVSHGSTPADKIANAQKAYNDEKASHKECYANFRSKASVGANLDADAAKIELKKYIFSILGLDIFPTANYSINGNSLTASSKIAGYYYCGVNRGPPLLTLPTDPNQIPVVVMRKLGTDVATVLYKTRTEKQSFKVFYNLIQKIYFLNTTMVHRDLHAGNMLFNEELKEFIIIDLGLAKKTGTRQAWSPGYADFYHGLEDHKGYPLDRNTGLPIQQGIFSQMRSRMEPYVPYNNSLPFLWEPFTPSATAQARVNFDIYSLLWGPGGELTTLNSTNSEDLKILIDMTADPYAFSHMIMVSTNFFECESVVRFFGFLFSWPNPLLRPLSFNVIKFLDKLILQRYKVKIRTDTTTIVEFESRIGVDKDYEITSLLQYSKDFVIGDPASKWSKSPFLQSYVGENYTIMCLQIISYYNAIIIQRYGKDDVILDIRDSVYSPVPGKIFLPGPAYSESERWKSLFSYQKTKTYINSLTQREKESIENAALSAIKSDLAKTLVNLKP